MASKRHSQRMTKTEWTNEQMNKRTNGFVFGA